MRTSPTVSSWKRTHLPARQRSLSYPQQLNLSPAHQRVRGSQVRGRVDVCVIFRSRPLSVSCGCSNKTSHAKQLKTTETSPLVVVEARSPKSSVGRTSLPPRAPEESPFFASCSFRRLLLLPAWGHVPAVSASCHTALCPS